MSIKIGDSVIVKAGIKEPDTEAFEIGGWQGRVIEIDPEFDNVNTMITIEWDSFTLQQMPDSYIHESEVDGLDWRLMNVFETDVEKSVARDKPENVIKQQDLLSDKFNWSSCGEEGLRISKILEGINPKDEMKCLQKWIDYLQIELNFPIEAKVKDTGGYGPFKLGDKVQIRSLAHIVDLYGIIATIHVNRKKFGFPLCDLQVVGVKSSNFQLIHLLLFIF
jgi:hypothetical protein